MRCRLCYRNSERGPTPTAFNSHSRPTHGSSHATHKALVHFVRFRYIYAGSLLVFLLGTAVISLIHFRPPQLQKPFSDFVTINTDWSAKVQQFQALVTETNELPSSINVGASKEQQYPSPGVRTKRYIGVRNTLSSTGFHPCAGDSASYDSFRLNLWDPYRGRGRLVVSLDAQPNLETFPSQFKNTSPVYNFLTQLASFRSLCTLQQRIANLKVYRRECLYSYLAASNATECCPMLSLPNLVASFMGLSSCNEVTTSHLNMVEALLLSCLPAFQSGQLSLSCWDIPGSDPSLLCPFVQPTECLKSPVIALLLATVLPDRADARTSWRHTLLVLPVRQTAGLTLFNTLVEAYQNGNLMRGLPVPIFLHGMYLHAYEDLVSDSLKRDTLWLIVGLVSLLIMLAVGSCSVSLPIITVVGIFWSLLIAFTLYTVVLRIPTFPVINFMAIVLAIGLGADDLLVYFQMWRASTRLAVNVHHSDSSTDNHLGVHAQPLTYELGTRPSAELRKKAKDAHTCGCQHRRDPNYLVQRLQMTLSHSIPSMTLTSVSTILGLLVNLMSSIVAVQRFAVFSVLLVLCNFIFVILTAPIVFLLFDSFYYESFTHRLHQLSRLFSAFILRACLILPCVSILAVCIAFYHLFFAHRFHLAQTGGKMSSFFSSTHPFEEFVNEQSQWFWAERNLHHYSNLLEAHFVWGFLPKDGRSFLTFDPDVHGLYSTKWVPDRSLNLTSPSSRRWISNFCNNHLKQFPYLFRLGDAISHTELYSPLGISHLKPYTTSPVWCPLGRFPNSVNNFVFAQACQSSSEHCCPSGHPLDVLDAPDTQFRSCLGEYVSYHLHTFPREYHSGYRFSFTGHSNEPVALILTVLTNLSTTTSTHAELHRFTENVASWFQASLLNAPASLIGGQVVVPALAAFEVTLNVVQYIHWSVLSSVFLATLLVLLSSLNLWLSVLAFLSLSSCLLTTLATLITFDHWTLGVVEGLVISLAAGLAIDPCIHLAVSVSSRTAKSSTVCRLFTFWSHDAVLQSVTVLSNAVTGSAFSTAIAGLSMVTCRLLCYHQIGAFLATLMSFSWLFCYLLFAGCLACCSRLFRTRRSNS